MINDKELINCLEQLYIEDPAGSQPTAFWKVLDMYERIGYKVDYDATGISRLVLRNKDSLITYYDRSNLPWELNSNDFKLIILNSKYIPETLQLANCKKYFKMVYRFEDIPSNHLSKDIRIVDVDCTRELTEVMSFINRCYDDINVTQEEVRSWTSRKVFDSSLWIWLIDITTGRKVGLGIAELDRTLFEGALEWIQIHPDFQSKGYGKIVVTELQHRLNNKAEFITVSGEENPYENAKKLYQRCGFYGDSIWTIAKR